MKIPNVGGTISLGVILRRSVTVPVVIVVEALLLCSSPLIVSAAVVVSMLIRSTRPLRSVVRVLAYAGIELSVLRRLLGQAADGWGADDWDKLLRQVLSPFHLASAGEDEHEDGLHQGGCPVR